MDELHRRLIRIGLDALADDFGYALAGGYAVQAHQIVNRVRDDVDLFAPINRATVEMPAATERVIAATKPQASPWNWPTRTPSTPTRG
ncbi:hypothetical protein PV963_31410 [Streptomyces coeruleorubidus]|uniref:hypothetical protein n=1 Tax=Streptomyces coeruleorubidus TaxID=116188 RepID=UPI00237F51BC|nr:hypothetical protein [Streptomyces coeruleorubidus]WDV54552.1 hypothetical protein PV963_31410 [Streptomyces coeruleorubidus]